MPKENVKKITDSIAEINKNMNHAKKVVKEKIQATAGTMNLAEIMNRHHLENQHSNIIGFLVAPEEKHHHPEYGKLFIQLLRNKGLENIKSDTITYIKREESTDESRRIDLFVETEDSLIIIENKIRAEDQPSQIHDYIKAEKENNPNIDESKIFVVYLTLDEQLPSESSLPEEELKKLVTEKRYMNLTYKRDILEWLAKLDFRDDEETLHSAIVQYIDVVKGLTYQRKEILNMESELAKELFNVYANESSDSLKTMLKNVRQFNEMIRLSMYIKFFEDLFDELKKVDKKGTLHCCGKSSYNNKEEWENIVKDKQIDFGVYYQHPDGYTEALIVDNAQSNFTFAIKSDKKDKNYKTWLKDYGNPTTKEGYQAAANPTSWFLKAILGQPEKNWENKTIKALAKHVAENWFW